MKYKVKLYHAYWVEAPNEEEAQSAAWKALDEGIPPDLGIGALVQPDGFVDPE